MVGVSPSWLIPGSVILLTFDGDYPLEAQQQLDLWLKTALDGVDRPQIHLMGDLTRMGHRWPALHEQLQFKSVHHPRVGRIVTVNATRDRILSFCIRTILRTTGKTYRDFETLEKAFEHLKQIDQTLTFPSTPSRSS